MRDDVDGWKPLLSTVMSTALGFTVVYALAFLGL